MGFLLACVSNSQSRPIEIACAAPLIPALKGVLLLPQLQQQQGFPGASIKKYPSAWKDVGEFIRKAKPEMGILFGSHSKGEAKERSDIDVLCVIGSTETEKIALSLRHKYNVKISPAIVSKEDFRNIKSENPELWEELVKFGIALKGQELFYDLVYRWGK